MLVVGFDVETTGLDVANDHIIEIGAILWDTEALPGAKKAKEKFDTLVFHDKLPLKFDDEIYEITGLTHEDCRGHGVSFQTAIEEFHLLCEQADAVVAHNGNMYDKPIYEANCKRWGIKPLDILWADTSIDIEYPKHCKNRSLSGLATFHQFLNPFPHDAVSDVLTMLKVADNYDWARTIQSAKSPTITLHAQTTFAQKELAKKQNYYWDNDSKRWLKRIKDYQLPEFQRMAGEAGFSVLVLKG